MLTIYSYCSQCDNEIKFRCRSYVYPVGWSGISFFLGPRAQTPYKPMTDSPALFAESLDATEVVTWNLLLKGLRALIPYLTPDSESQCMQY